MMFTVTSGVLMKHVCICFTRNMYTLSPDKSLTSNNAIRFGSTLMPLLPHDPGIYRQFTLLVSLCMDIPQTSAAIKKNDIHENKRTVNSFIILGM